MPRFHTFVEVDISGLNGQFKAIYDLGYKVSATPDHKVLLVGHNTENYVRYWTCVGEIAKKTRCMTYSNNFAGQKWKIKGIASLSYGEMSDFLKAFCDYYDLFHKSAERRADKLNAVLKEILLSIGSGEAQKPSTAAPIAQMTTSPSIQTKDRQPNEQIPPTKAESPLFFEDEFEDQYAVETATRGVLREPAPFTESSSGEDEDVEIQRLREEKAALERRVGRLRNRRETASLLNDMKQLRKDEKAEREHLAELPPLEKKLGYKRTTNHSIAELESSKRRVCLM